MNNNYLDRYLSVSLCNDTFYNEDDSYTGLETEYENMFDGTWVNRRSHEYIPEEDGHIIVDTRKESCDDIISSAEMIRIIADWSEDKNHHVYFEEGGDIMLKLAECNTVTIDSDPFRKIGEMWSSITGELYSSKSLARYISIVNNETDWDIVYN